VSRIRSIHPGQWTDEDFVQCSFAARLLCIGLRNEADDNGVFEWKPVSLRMKLFPADAVDINALLAELIEHRHVAKYEANGKTYGLIRNFLKYQRPKKPTCIHPLPNKQPEFRTSSEPVPHQSSKVSAEEGGRRKEESPYKSPKGDGYTPEFEVLWKRWPKKAGKGAAAKAYRRALTRATAEEIAAGIERAIPELAKREEQFRPHLSTWLGEDRWLDEPDNPAQQSGDPETNNLRQQAKLLASLTPFAKSQAQKLPSGAIPKMVKLGLLPAETAAEYGVKS
jgi:hypothetical protein